MMFQLGKKEKSEGNKKTGMTTTETDKTRKHELGNYCLETRVSLLSTIGYFVIYLFIFELLYF